MTFFFCQVGRGMAICIYYYSGVFLIFAYVYLYRKQIYIYIM